MVDNGRGRTKARARTNFRSFVRIRKIDFPEPLLRSQREDRLVVFAGAGVSIPAPSNYPGFDGLADKVASGVLTRRPHEPTDVFLGRLHDKHLEVHNLVAKILTDPNSQPNSLHFDLLKLFQARQTLRLVTTNFDQHFTKAAAAVFGPEGTCETYNAPALPLGDSFNGIVYLHGSAEKPPERLVLTDRDFGRAYLTEGWARIFLQKLFSRYTVLFVGYIGVLIDIAYELIRWNNLHRHERADALIAQWSSSESLVLKRLAIIGVADSTHWSPDQKMSWLLTKDLIFAYPSAGSLRTFLQSFRRE